MARLLLVLFLTALYKSVLCEEQESRIVQISQGPVRGYKDHEENLYTFFGIPYATAPTGQDRYKAPLPGPSWLTPFDADNDNIICPQAIIPAFKHLYKNADMRQNCLIANVYVPDTVEKSLPVLVVVHGGGFQVGSGNLLKVKKLVASNNIIAVTFNYRLGIHGFLCLGTQYAPGNAGMKDQVALLKWVNENIANFGGNPNDVTITGYSAGAVSVELLMLSPLAKGLFNKAIAESGGALGVFAMQTDPLENAKGFAKRFEIEHADDAYALEDFYKNASFETITSDSFFSEMFSPLFTPCIESEIGQEIFLADSPINILKSGDYEKVPFLVGFNDKEGISRIDSFETWKNNMNQKFSDFLPPDLQFRNKAEEELTAKDIKEFYFGDKKVDDDTILSFVDFMSDVSFAYPILKAVQLHANAGNNKIFLYLYNYVDELIPVVPHTDVKGATHCAQTFGVFDGYMFSNDTERDLPHDYKKHKVILRQMWGNFIKTGAPVPEGSSLATWPPTGADGSPHMLLGQSIELQDSALLQERRRMWDAVYSRHYRAPSQPQAFVLFSRNEL
uniref:Carboxylic ester hydrolase n=1 Tax=Chilo suppressalis TaxID=168631 RepID=A0A0B4RY77_CHISP|nr:carboxyl/choline esterase [Chilo suppressalis]